MLEIFTNHNQQSPRQDKHIPERAGKLTSGMLFPDTALEILAIFVPQSPFESKTPAIIPAYPSQIPQFSEINHRLREKGGPENWAKQLATNLFLIPHYGPVEQLGIDGAIRLGEVDQLCRIAAGRNITLTVETLSGLINQYLHPIPLHLVNRGYQIRHRLP